MYFAQQQLTEQEAVSQELAEKLLTCVLIVGRRVQYAVLAHEHGDHDVCRAGGATLDVW